MTTSTSVSAPPLQVARTAGAEAKSVTGAITSMGINELISGLAIGIAHGQMELDEACMDIAKFMGEPQIAFGKKLGTDEPDLMSLIELGFTPNFYQFVDTILEVRVAISSKFEEKQENTSETDTDTTNKKKKIKTVSAANVDAKYASTYNFSVEASSLIKTKIVPVPPPAVFEEILRAKIQERRDLEERMSWTDQAKGILTSVQSLVTPFLSLTIPASVASVKADNAKQLQDNLSALKERYNQLTADHWSVIQSASDQQAADTALAGAVGKAADLAKMFTATPPVKDETLTGLLQDLQNFVKSFNTKIGAMLAKLTAPALPA